MNLLLAPRAALALAVVTSFASALPCGAQTMVDHSERTSFSSGLPDASGSSWDRVGTGYALILDGDELLLNDNSSAELIAFQGLLGQIESAHDVVFRAEVRVVSNVGGDGALIEISRPGMEVLVQLFPEGIVLMERDGRTGERWLGSVDVDLSEFREVAVHKTSRLDPAGEQVIVSVGGQELIRAKPHGTGDLDLGRVLFGSLGYVDFGATLWRWVEVDARVDVAKIPTTDATMGQLKGRFRD